MATHFLQDPDFTRFGFLPLSYYMKHLAMNKELILDHIDGMAYYYLEETKEYIPLNDPTAIYHLRDYNNPHQVTKEQVGLGEVDNIRQAPLKDFNKHINDFNNPHRVTKEQIGLGNVNNVIPIPKSEFDLYNKTIEKYIEELKNLQESIEFFASDRYRLTINTDPEDAIVRVRYNKKWNVGKLHKLPDGTYKFEVEWGGDTEPDDEEGLKPKEEKKYKVKAYMSLDVLQSHIVWYYLNYFFSGFIIYDEFSNNVVYSFNNMVTLGDNFLIKEFELPVGNYRFVMIPKNNSSYGSGIGIYGGYAAFIVEENNDNKFEVGFMHTTGMGFDISSILTESYLHSLASSNGKYIINSNLCIYEKDEENSIYELRDCFFTFDDSLRFKEGKLDKSSHRSFYKYFNLIPSLSKLKLILSDNNDIFAAINDTGDTVFLISANNKNICYFIKKENDIWNIKKEVNISSYSEDIPHSVFYNYHFNITWSSSNILKLKNSAITIDFNTLEVYHNTSSINNERFTTISNNSKYAIIFNEKGFNNENKACFYIYKLNDLNKYEKELKVVLPDPYSQIGVSDIFYQKFNISDDGNEIIYATRKRIFYIKRNGNDINWVSNMNIEGSSREDSDIDWNYEYDFIRTDFKNKKIFVSYDLSKYTYKEYISRKIPLIEILTFKNNVILKDDFIFPLRNLYRFSETLYEEGTFIDNKIFNVTFVKDVGWLCTISIDGYCYTSILINYKKSLGYNIGSGENATRYISGFDNFINFIISY